MPTRPPRRRLSGRVTARAAPTRVALRRQHRRQALRRSRRNLRAGGRVSEHSRCAHDCGARIERHAPHARPCTHRRLVARRSAQRLRAHDPTHVYNAHHAARHAHRHRVASALGGDAADAAPLRDRRAARAHARAWLPLPHLRIARVGHGPGPGAHARAPAAAAAPRRARVARRRLAHQRRRARREHPPVADRHHLLERGLLRLAQLPARTEIAPISR